MEVSRFIDWVRRHQFILALGMIIITAVVMRFYRLGSVPPGFTWDEAAVAYNGYAVTTTRRDEWLQFLPISFQSFGDYKAPAAMYLTGPLTTLFGANPIVFRSLFAVSGVISVFTVGIISYWMGMWLWRERSAAQLLMVVTTASAALAPWMVHFSRVGFESGLAMTAMLLGMLSLWRWIQHVDEALLAWPQFVLQARDSASTFIRRWTPLSLEIFVTYRQHISTFWLTMSGLWFVAALYLYHSPKIILPLLLGSCGIVLLFRYHQQLLERWRELCIALTINLLAVTPLLIDLIRGAGSTRFEQSSLFGLELTPPALLRAISTRILYHLSPGFLVQGWTLNLRHGFGGWGMLLPTTFALCSVGVLLFLWLCVRHTRTSLQEKRLRSAFFVLFVIILIAITPASIGRELHHSNRALFMAPWLLLLSGVTVVSIYRAATTTQFLSNRLTADTQRILAKAWLGMALLLHVLVSSAFYHYYFTQYPALAGDAFQEGYLEAVAAVEAYRSRDVSSEKVVFTDHYGQPYIYVLLEREINPIVYRQGGLADYLFKTVDFGDLERPDTVVVAGPDAELFGATASRTIEGSDGAPQFRIFYPGEER